jgi:hypothetical protein
MLRSGWPHTYVVHLQYSHSVIVLLYFCIYSNTGASQHDRAERGQALIDLIYKQQI